MKHDGIVTSVSLLTVILITLHFASDVVRGLEPGNLSYLAILVLIVGVWLYGTLLLPGRRGGNIILLIGSLLALVIPVVHMKGAGITVGARGEGDFFFVWVLLALGASAAFLFVLAARGLLVRRRTGSERSGPGEAEPDE
jgi:hypothetical protein